MACDTCSGQEWVEDAARRLPGPTMELIQAEFVSTMREFFSRSSCWTADLTPQDIVAGQVEYCFDPITAGVVINYMRIVRVGVYPIRPMPTLQVRNVTPADQPSSYSNPEPNTVILYPIPAIDIADGLSVNASLIPTTCDVEFPSYIKTQFYEPLFDGLLGRMYSYPDRPWTSPELAKYHLRRFRSGMARVRGIAEQGLNRSSGLWAFPSYANNGGQRR